MREAFQLASLLACQRLYVPPWTVDVGKSRIPHLKGTFVPSYIRTLLSLMFIPHSAFRIPQFAERPSVLVCQRRRRENKNVVGR
jgi:hypothetical protein